MMVKLTLKVVLGLCLVALGGVMFSANSSKISTTVKAQTSPDIETQWKATKLLVINTHGTYGGEISTVKTRFAIGVAGWSVVYAEKDSNGMMAPKYEEVWSLPDSPNIPNCYYTSYENYMSRNSPCNRSPGKWLWSYAHENNWNEGIKLTFEEANVDDNSLYTPVAGASRGGGPGGIPGVNNSNVNVLLATGAYGWAHIQVDDDYSNASGGIVRAGMMMPLQWTVKGYFK